MLSRALLRGGSLVAQASARDTTQAQLAQHAEVLTKVAERHGVDPATVVAVWGVESNFGRNFGNYPLVQALGTLSCFGRRQAYFRGEFYSSLRILQAGHVAPERLVPGTMPRHCTRPTFSASSGPMSSTVSMRARRWPCMSMSPYRRL